MVKSFEAQKLSFSIDGEEKIPAIEMVGTIQHIQNIIFHLGDYFYGNPSRPKGDFPQVIKDSCTLFVTNIEMGSVHAEMQIGDAQVGITDLGTLGERAICATNELIETLSHADVSKEELGEIIKDPHRLNKVLKEFYLMWPDPQSKRSLTFGFSGKVEENLNPEQKEVIRSILRKPVEEYEKEVFGRVYELRVDKNRRIQIDTPEGAIDCNFTADIEEDIKDIIGNIVTIRGVMKPSKGKFVLSIDSEVSIERNSRYYLASIKRDEIEVKLKEEVPIDIEFEDDYYIASNDDLGLLAVQPKMKLLIEELKGQLNVLWQEYVLADEEELAPSGKDLREMLISIVGA
ncbi:TPA: hypothetical protein HA338_13960 [Methanosarcina acetivorans]|uniref:Uncharacterized protein n=2 Tax=Methanosarcina acetivorans TaxID=2214 RepID=Q8TUG9_METAC|nr:hypothetical protein [Methanosarcina acetivorans]AAM03552.1 predicted protein [Methanosarcina acetivorans C2A]HIH95066.1 hypothetical protein [Methanosarcina acetivorans]